MPVRPKKNGSDFQAIRACRICKQKHLLSFLDMGKMPLVNSFFKNKKEKAPSFPVRVLFCPHCGLVQLSGVVNPELIFSNYAYQSSFSKTFQEHCTELAVETLKRFSDLKNGRVLDIGSNDGCLLQAFKEQGFVPLGIEPSLKLAQDAKKKGIPTLADYWGSAAAKAVLKGGSVQVITATSVLAQVADLHSFVQNCQTVLSSDGIMVAEVHYSANLILQY